MSTRSGKPTGQQPTELAWFLNEVEARDVHRYLEVGVRYGDTFVQVAERMAPGGLLVAVDLPGSLWGRQDSEPFLREACDYGRSLGHEVHLVLGDSRNPAIIEQVGDLGPFDLAFIDGDHTLRGVTADVAHYGPMAAAIALHDISTAAPNKVDVPELWRALCAVAPTTACVAKGSVMGIGIVECAR